MTKRIVAHFALALAMLFTTQGAAFAGSAFKGELSANPFVAETSTAWGDVSIQFKKGLVKVEVGGLPGNKEGQCLPMTLSDVTTRPQTKMEAKNYEAWLLRVEMVNGAYVFTNAQSIGSLKTEEDGSGALKVTVGDLRDRGFNVFAVAAEEDLAPYAWMPGDNFMDAFMSNRSSNGVIILWTLIQPLP